MNSNQAQKNNLKKSSDSQVLASFNLGAEEDFLILKKKKKHSV